MGGGVEVGMGAEVGAVWGTLPNGDYQMANGESLLGNIHPPPSLEYILGNTHSLPNDLGSPYWGVYTPKCESLLRFENLMI